MGTPLLGNTPKLLLLGSGELGREVAIEAMRLGAEVVAVDRYALAPAMQVAHRSHVIPMTDAGALRAVVRREAPDVIVPEIEQIATDELVRLEEEGWTVVPGAEATRATMHRERIRLLAAKRAHVPTSDFAFADSLEEARGEAARLGFPCVFKALTSSSGHGMTIVRDPSQVVDAYTQASEHGRVANPRIMIEQFLRFDAEVTMLTLRHFDATGRIATTVMDPIAHVRPGTLYHESWQPAPFEPEVRAALADVARAVTAELGGVGMFGVECFVAGRSVYFSEVSPRPHDTGLVTLVSQSNSEFALHARAILGLPWVGPEVSTPAAAHVILSSGAGWAPRFGGLARALATEGVRVHLFGKPEGYLDRRLGVALACASTIEEARASAARAAHLVEAAIHFGPDPRS